MKSIAEDDLGETLLVYTNEDGTNIVADGNRRLSALKVLHDDDYAPTDTIKAYAQELREANTLDFTSIQAQVSSNKELVAKTVHERHSGGGNGTRRQDWKAYANARFGFDNKVGDHKEWYIMALLVKTEEEHPELEVNGTTFPYETYRRIVRTALAKQRISNNIFAERGAHIKKTARPDLVKDAVSKSLKIIQALGSKELSLSRKDDTTYADKSNIDAYIEAFELSPDNAELERSREASGQSGDKQIFSSSTQGQEGSGQSDSSDHDHTQTSSDPDDQSGDNTASNENDVGAAGGRGSGYRVNESQDIKDKLDALDSFKLKRLYKSLCKISLNDHPEIMYAGAWMFFELLSKYAGNVNQKGRRQHEFTAFLNGRMQSHAFQEERRDSCYKVLLEIQDFGNAAKHSITRTRATAQQLKLDFDLLESTITMAIDEAISLKQKEQAA
jgi:hypothetical protein